MFSSGGGPCLTDVAAHAATADVKVSFTIASTMASFDAGVCARADLNETGSTGAAYILDVFNGTYDVYRRFNGTNTALRSTSATTVEGDVWTLEVSGTGATVTLKIYRNGVQQGTDITDSSGSRITAANRTGLYSWVAGSAYDNFLVEDLAGGGGTVNDVTVSDTLAVADGSIASAVRAPIVGEAIVISDESLQFYRRNRLLESFVSITDEALASLLTGNILTRILSDALNVSDELLARCNRQRLLESFLVMNDDALTAMQRFIVLTDAVTVADDFTAALVAYSSATPRIVIGFDQPNIVIGFKRLAR